MIDLTKFNLKPIYKNNVLDHYGLVPKAEPAIYVDIEPKQPAICVDQSLSMTKTVKQAIMDYFGVELVPESLLKELEAIMSEQVIGGDVESVSGHDIPGHPLNLRLAEQRQALRQALYGKDKK